MRDYLANNARAFSPACVRAMRTAFGSACHKLGIEGAEMDDRKYVLANAIIKAMKRDGICDAANLERAAVEALATPKGRPETRPRAIADLRLSSTSQGQLQE